MPKQAQGKTRRNQLDTPKQKLADLKIKNAQDAEDIRDARGALKESRKKGSVSWEQTKREVGI
jgi:hypothetical protein